MSENTGLTVEAVVDLSNDMNKVKKEAEGLLKSFLNALVSDETVANDFDIDQHMIFISFSDFSKMSDSVKSFVKDFSPTITVSSSVVPGEVYLMTKDVVAKNLEVA